MNSNAQGFWYDIIRRLGLDPPLPPVDDEEAWAEYLDAPESQLLPEQGHSERSVSDRGEAGSGLLKQPAPGSLAQHTDLAEIYREVHKRAELLMRRQPSDHTLQTTALVNEAFLRLMRQDHLEQADREHVLALAVTAMRQILVDRARRRARNKHGPPGERLSGDDIASAFEERALDLEALDEALSKLARFDPTMARAVELHFFGGLSLEDTACAIGVPSRTFERHWAATKAWLRAEIEG